MLAPLLIAAATAITAVLADMLWGARWAAAAGWVGMFLAAGASGYTTLSDSQLLLDVVGAGRPFGTICAVIFFLAGIALLGGRRRIASDDRGGQAAVLVVMTALAAAVTASAIDLVLQFIAIEVGALSAYGLVALGRSRRSDEAALKYFVLGAIAAALFVLALALGVGPAGSSQIGNLGILAESGGSGAALAATMLLLAVYGFKLGVFPFHSWAPDVYETSPPVYAGAMATLPKIGIVAAAYLALRLGTALDIVPAVAWTVAALSVASIAYGNLAGLKQTSYTRMLAYSGIAQVGYVLIAVACVGAGEVRGLTLVPSMLLVMMYAVAALGAFMGAEAVRSSMPDWDGTVSGLVGFSRVRPWTAAGMSVCMLSLTGIPLTAGFWGKFLVFASALSYSSRTHEPVWAVLVAVGAVGSVVSFGYYGRVLRAMYLEDAGTGERDTAGGSAGPSDHAVVTLAVVVALGGVLPLVFGLEGVLGLLAGL